MHVNDTDKKKLYNANMESYLELMRQKDSQIPTVRLAVDELNKEGGGMQLPDDVIVEHIPKIMRSRASALLNRLKARPVLGQARIEPGQEESNIGQVRIEPFKSKTGIKQGQ